MSHKHGEPYVPTLPHVTTPKWVGGTWTGRCGSTCWVPASAGIQLTERQRSTEAHVTSSQAWFNNDFHGQRQEGFWVVCELEHKHEGPCKVHSAPPVTIEWSPA